MNFFIFKTCLTIIGYLHIYVLIFEKKYINLKNLNKKVIIKL